MVSHFRLCPQRHACCCSSYIFPFAGAQKFVGFCGFMSILSSMRHCLGPSDSFGSMWAALAFMPFGLFFDFMDGKVARWRGKSSLMGQELDSLADLVHDGFLDHQFYLLHPSSCAKTLHRSYIRPLHRFDANIRARFPSVWHLRRAPLLLASALPLTPCSFLSLSSADSLALPASTLPSPLYQRTVRARANTSREHQYLPL